VIRKKSELSIKKRLLLIFWPHWEREKGVNRNTRVKKAKENLMRTCELRPVYWGVRCATALRRRERTEGPVSTWTQRTHGICTRKSPKKKTLRPEAKGKIWSQIPTAGVGGQTGLAQKESNRGFLNGQQSARITFAKRKKSDCGCQP